MLDEAHIFWYEYLTFVRLLLTLYCRKDVYAVMKCGHDHNCEEHSSYATILQQITDPSLDTTSPAALESSYKAKCGMFIYLRMIISTTGRLKAVNCPHVRIICI